MDDNAQDAALITDLRALGRAVAPPETDLTTAVMARLPATPPARRPVLDWGVRRRVLVAALVVLLGCLGVPGVRAAVVDWFAFDGVKVQIQPMPAHTVTTAPPPPAALGTTSLEQARSLVRFRPVRLTALGPPKAVEVSADHRLLSLTWAGPGGKTIRLDEFDGTLDYLFAKTARGAEWTQVGGTSALWFETPHEVVILDAAGQPRTETARLAGHTLIWEQHGAVLRLEGDITRQRALEIAASAEPLD